MVRISDNQIITMNRGDTFSIPLLMYFKDTLNTEEIKLKSGEKVYFRVAYCNTSWENAEIKKEYTFQDVLSDGRVLVSFTSSDTNSLQPGKYYYEVKFEHIVSNNEIKIDTIVPRREFIIIE